MPYNPLAITDANATPEQVAASGQGTNAAMSAYNMRNIAEENNRVMQALAAAQMKEQRRRQNKAYGQVGQLAGAALGGFAGAGTGIGALGGAAIGAGLGGAIGGQGENPGSMIPDALTAANGLNERRRLQAYGAGSYGPGY